MEVKRLTCPEGRKQIKKSDGNGLFLLVKSSGSKLWRMRYRFSGKHQELAVGQYPTIPLIEVRNLAAQARSQLAQGINPTAERRERKQSSVDNNERIFSEVALAWWEQQKSSWSPEHARKVKRWIDFDMKPLGKLPVEVVDQGHITKVMLSIEVAGNPRKAPVVLSAINRIFGYALIKNH